MHAIRPGSRFVMQPRPDSLTPSLPVSALRATFGSSPHDRPPRRAYCMQWARRSAGLAHTAALGPTTGRVNSPLAVGWARAGGSLTPRQHARRGQPRQPCGAWVVGRPRTPPAGRVPPPGRPSRIYTRARITRSRSYAHPAAGARSQLLRPRDYPPKSVTWSLSQSLRNPPNTHH